MSAPHGPIGEAGETARTLISGLSSNPLVLALVVIDLATLGLLYWQGTLAESERRTSLELLYKNRTEVGQLLTKCR